MKLFEVYQGLLKDEITEGQAAAAFNMTPESLRRRMGMHGAKFPRVLKTLDKLAVDKISRNEAANYLHVGVRTVNALMGSWHVRRPPAEYLLKRAAAGVKWEIRKKHAIDFIAGSCTAEEAAENAEVTERQMRRWVSGLLKTHYGMVWKDLRELSEHRRRRLADEIETKEGLELAKQQVLNEIARGNRKISEEALARVTSKRTRGGAACSTMN